MNTENELSGVSFQAELPLGWAVQATPPAAPQLSGWMHTNTVLLRALAMLEIQPPERDPELANEQDHRFERLEAKLDLALDLLSGLIAQHTPQPETRSISLSANAIAWVGSDAPSPGQTLLISLFISPRLPQPLRLPARVRASTAAAGGMRTVAEFTHLDESTRDWLERTVFRNHRRFIQARHRE